MAKKNVDLNNLPYLPKQSLWIADANIMESKNMIYLINRYTENAPPRADGGVLIHLTHNGTQSINQLAFCWASEIMYYRRYVQEWGWQEWRQIAYLSDIPT